MRAFSAVIVVLLCLTLMMGGGESLTSATSSIQQSFGSKYGSELVNRYSCQLCHPPGVFTEFNPYGEDLLAALEQVGGCQEFHPPNSHTKALGRCEYMHMEGYNDPGKNCSLCHGVELKGLIAPSCYLCHGARWSQSVSPAADQPVKQVMSVETAFSEIETLDSDGDGFTNLAEIEAGSHPGDATIFPGGADLTVEMASKWKRSWVGVKGDIKVVLTPGGGNELSAELPVYLMADGGKLYASNMELNGKDLNVFFPKALLYSIIKNINADKIEATVVAETAAGDKLMYVAEITLYGTAPDFITGVSLKINPKTWVKDKDVTFLITDTKNQISADNPFNLVGPDRSVTINNATRAGTKIKIELKGADALDLMGAAVENTPYTIGVYAKGVVKGKVLAINKPVKVTVGGGGDECYDFNPPASHNQARQRGTCTYMHAPGLSQPYSNACNACHGQDLQGSTFAPSCLLCHGQYWANPTPENLFNKEAK